MTTPADVPRSALGQLTLLGEGGQGKVFRTSGHHLLYKEYLQPQGVRVDRLRALLQVLPQLPPEHQRLLARSTAFPHALVEDRGAFSGILMSPADAAFSARVGTREQLLELQYLTYPKKPVWRDLHIPDTAWKLRFLQSCADLFTMLHRYDLVVGDVSMRNLLWSATAETPVFLLDCDSMRVQGDEPGVPAAMTPGWDDPCEVGKPSAAWGTQDSDRYKLALVVLRVLTTRPHARPGDGSEAHLPVGCPPGIAALLAEVAAAPEGKRPTAQRWADVLQNRTTIRLRPLGPPRQRRAAPPALVRPVIVPKPRP